MQLFWIRYEPKGQCNDVMFTCVIACVQSHAGAILDTTDPEILTQDMFTGFTQSPAAYIIIYIIVIVVEH